VIEEVTRKRLALFTGRANPELAVEMAEHLGIELGRVEVRTFASGEIYSRYLESVRGSDAFVLQSMGPPLNDNLVEHLIMIDALRRASAKRVTAVLPYYPYARQDKKALSREPISTRLMANLYEAAGVDRVISVDLHTGQIQGFHSVPLDHLTALPLLSDFIAGQTQGSRASITIVSPDAGGVRMAEKFGRRLQAPIAFLHKRRNREVAHQVEHLDVVGEVQGRICVIVDDIVDTAGTVCSAAEMLVRRGAAGVRLAATHAVFSGDAIDRLKNAPFEQVVVTNTVPVPYDIRFPGLEVLSIAPIVATAIRNVFEDLSVSAMSDGLNDRF